MLGLDTNVLVRFLVRDSEAQFDKARRLIRREAERGEPVLLSLLVLLEAEWVLRSRYGHGKEDIQQVLSGLLDAADLRIEDEAVVEEALFMWKDSASDFADCLIGARNRRLGCDATVSFDAKAAKLQAFRSVDAELAGRR